PVSAGLCPPGVLDAAYPGVVASSFRHLHRNEAHSHWLVSVEAQKIGSLQELTHIPGDQAGWPPPFLFPQFFFTFARKKSIRFPSGLRIGRRSTSTLGDLSCSCHRFSSTYCCFLAGRPRRRKRAQQTKPPFPSAKGSCQFRGAIRE